MRPEEYESCSLRSGPAASLTREQCRAARICWWCGTALTGRQVYWCGSGEHRPCEREWRQLHDWTTARTAAMARAGGRCLRCGARADEVNHRTPLVGRGYHSGCVHHPDNLEPLCHDCHTAETTRQLYERRQAAIDAGRDYFGRRARRRLGLPQIPSTPTPGFRRDAETVSLWDESA
jgi:5-methylcytosine-specific restriction endonuclease McrA